MAFHHIKGDGEGETCEWKNNFNFPEDANDFFYLKIWWKETKWGFKVGNKEVDDTLN